MKNLSKIGATQFGEGLFGNDRKEEKNRDAKGTGCGESDEENNQEEATGTDDERASSESLRSAGKGSVARSDRIIDPNDSLNQEGSLNGSLDDHEFNKRNFAEMKDDRAIVKIAAINDKYKLVERPRFLFSFDTTTWESKFATSVFRKHFSTELCTYLTKVCFDLLMSQALVYAIWKTDRIDINILVALGVLILRILDTMLLFFRKVKKPRAIPYQLFFFVVTFGTIIMIGPMVFNLVFRESLEVTFAILMMLAFLTRSF